jgi:hypothetical protein
VGSWPLRGPRHGTATDRGRPPEAMDKVVGSALGCSWSLRVCRPLGSTGIVFTVLLPNYKHGRAKVTHYVGRERRPKGRGSESLEYNHTAGRLLRV